MKRAALAAVLMLFLSSCGSAAEEPVAEPSAAQEPSEPESTYVPEYIENQTCRDDMQPILDLMLANQRDDLYLDDFADRQKRLTREFKDDDAACSNAVASPARGAMYDFALANVGYTLCKNNATCSFGPRQLGPIQKNIRKGIRKATRAQENLIEQQ